jgi:hypothetical protein
MFVLRSQLLNNILIAVHCMRQVSDPGQYCVPDLIVSMDGYVDFHVPALCHSLLSVCPQFCLIVRGLKLRVGLPIGEELTQLSLLKQVF